MTRKREVLPSGGSQRGVPTPPPPPGARARGSSGPAVHSQARAQLPAAAGRGRVHRQPGGGQEEARPGAGRGGWRRPRRRRRSERVPAALPAATWGAAEAGGGAERGDDGGAGLPRAATALLRPPGAGLAALSIRARRRQLVRARSARLARRRLLRSPAASTEATVSVLGSPPPPPPPRVGPEDERPERFPAAASLGSPARRRYRLGADGTRASWRPPAEPRGEDFQLFLLRLVVTCPPIVTPIRLLFH